MSSFTSANALLSLSATASAWKMKQTQEQKNTQERKTLESIRFGSSARASKGSLSFPPTSALRSSFGSSSDRGFSSSAGKQSRPREAATEGGLPAKRRKGPIVVTKADVREEIRREKEEAKREQDRRREILFYELLADKKPDEQNAVLTLSFDKQINTGYTPSKEIRDILQNGAQTKEQYKRRRSDSAVKKTIQMFDRKMLGSALSSGIDNALNVIDMGNSIPDKDMHFSSRVKLNPACLTKNVIGNALKIESSPACLTKNVIGKALKIKSPPRGPPQTDMGPPQTKMSSSSTKGVSIEDTTIDGMSKQGLLAEQKLYVRKLLINLQDNIERDKIQEEINKILHSQVNKNESRCTRNRKGPFQNTLHGIPEADIQSKSPDSPKSSLSPSPSSTLDSSFKSNKIISACMAPPPTPTEEVSELDQLSPTNAQLSEAPEQNLPREWQSFDLLNKLIVMKKRRLEQNETIKKQQLQQHALLQQLWIEQTNGLTLVQNMLQSKTPKIERKRRRSASELEENEQWRCPHGCGRIYRKASTVSIRKHIKACPLELEKIKVEEERRQVEEEDSLPVPVSASQQSQQLNYKILNVCGSAYPNQPKI